MMKEMHVKTIAFNANAKPNEQEDIRRISVEFDGLEFIIEADAGGLVIQLKNRGGLIVAPNSPSMLHLTRWP
jgi:hypothetical protein